MNQCPRICLIAKFGAKIKILELGTKNTLFGYFGAGIWKYYCHIWNQRPQTCVNAKFGAKIKILNLEPKISYLGILGQQFDNNTVIFEISALELA